jgi:hypothetical protein
VPLADPGSIIQYTTGIQFDAAGAQFDFTVTLPQAAQVGNSLFMLAASTPTNAYLQLFPGEAWGDYYNAYQGAPLADEPQFQIRMKFVVAARSAFPWRVPTNSLSVPTSLAWMMVEVAGCEPFWNDPANPWTTDDAYPRYTYTGQAVNNDQTGTVAQLSTGTGATTTQGNGLFVPAGFATTQLAGGTPPAVTDFQNSATQPGVWTQIGGNVAAINGSATSVGLDVAYKITPAPATYGCVANYAAAPTGGISCCTGAFLGDRIPALQTQRRRANTSMV